MYSLGVGHLSSKSNEITRQVIDPLFEHPYADALLARFVRGREEKCMGRLEEQVAVITGGTSGIGRACAKRFVAEGAKVAIAGRRNDVGERLAAALGSNTLFMRTDVTRESDIRALIARTLDHFGRIDCVVSSAGAGSRTRDIAGTAAADLEHDFSLHVRAAFLLMKYAAPSMMRRRSGCFINMSSVSAHRAGFNAFGYEVAKAALTHFTRCAALELGEHGVRVNSISPGPTLTNIFAPLTGESIEDDEVLTARVEAAFLQQLPSIQPMPGMARAEDIANAAVFLATSESRFVNGHDLIVDGGLCAGRPASVRASAFTALRTGLRA
jgi:NAD(P)-dependent dehydrogenase (short-subunit alcohol dehydrogenase family)